MTVVAGAPVRVAEARLTGYVVRGIAIESRIAVLTAIPPVARRAGANLRAIGQQPARIGKVALYRRARARFAAVGLVRITIVTPGTLVTVAPSCILTAILIDSRPITKNLMVYCTHWRMPVLKVYEV